MQGAAGAAGEAKEDKPKRKDKAANSKDLEAWKIVAKELAGAFTRIHEQLEDLGGERGGKRKRDKGDATGDKRKKREVGGPPALKKRPAGTSCRFPLRWLAARR
jgi:hypothetical protein